MNVWITKSSLPDSEARLVELLQQLNFGRVEALKVHDGLPCFDPPPRVIQKFKMRAENGTRLESTLPDFRLKRDLLELLNLIRTLKSGEIQVIEVRYGLPVSVDVQWEDYRHDNPMGDQR